MRFIPGDGVRFLDRYEVQDGALLLGIANERGDITAYVRRADGTRAHSFGGPVYDPPEFLNVCQRCERERDWCWPSRQCSPRPDDMSDAERRTATALAHKVGWIQ